MMSYQFYGSRTSVLLGLTIKITLTVYCCPTWVTVSCRKENSADYSSLIAPRSAIRPVNVDTGK